VVGSNLEAHPGIQPAAAAGPGGAFAKSPAAVYLLGRGVPAGRRPHREGHSMRARMCATGGASKPGCAFALRFVWARHDHRFQHRPNPQRSPRLKQPDRSDLKQP
jgi:hypothetical protein